MASDCGSSGSSELDDEPSRGRVDEWDSIIALDAKNVAGDPESISQDSPEEETPRLVTVTARAYQIEMLEESLKRNIIVAMDTGSGKTQVAILRIQTELERSEQIVWFLAPTVSLAQQQFEVIRAQIAGVQSKCICGDNDASAWSSKPGVWDAVLFNTRIVVSTYQVLFDAVSHALVPLSSLALIVIDEAHNCVGRNAVRRLMDEHYSINKAKGLPVPHMLGLTASPVMRSNLADLEVLEQTLDAVCKTPSRHRDELMAQVNRPEMVTIAYGSLPEPEGAGSPTPTMARLRKVYLGLDMRQDPIILELLAQNTPWSRKKLQKLYMEKKTFSQTQIKSLCTRSREICERLGPWAADYYIHGVISMFLKDLASSYKRGEGANEESRYMAEAFRKVDARPPPPVPTTLSARVDALINTLESHKGNPVGIVFVTERATAAVLSHILSFHPRTRGRYRVGSMVGTAKGPGRSKSFLDLSRKEDLLSLHAFRKGKINLLVATSVLEEGIDVPACNLVVCFDEPANLKSFIQRRGRARKSASKLYLLVNDESSGPSEQWQALEQEMKRKYEDDMRENESLGEIEKSEPLGYPVLRDEETGAQITIHDAKQHLDHFCTTLSTRKFVDWRPYYVVHDLQGNPVGAHVRTLRKATVHLPVSLAPELRRFESLRAWDSETNACKDAAFQAYAKLYETGLVNRHLLPIWETDFGNEVGLRASVAEISEQLNPWPLIAQAWRDKAATSRRRLTISNQDNSARADFEVVLPVEVPYIQQFVLYWGYSSSWLVSMEPETPLSKVGSEVDGKADLTSTMLAMAFGHRWPVGEKQYPVSFVCLDQDIIGRLEDRGTKEISAELMAKVSSTHLIRDVVHQNSPYFYLEWLPTKPSVDLVGKTYPGFDEAPEHVPHVAVKNWPKRVNSFRPPHPNGMPTASSKPYPRVLPADIVQLDNIPAVYAHVGMLIPSITHAFEIYLVAKDLLEHRLEATGITDLSLVVTAISTRNAQGPTDYERVEFLGDSILKLCTTINCSAQYLKFPEGCLSPLKDKIVANSRLAQAAIDFGLDRYIIYSQAPSYNGRSMYVEDLLENPPPETETRTISTKILADVVEALIGTSFVSGGISKALACMSLFLPEVKWESIDHGREILYNEAPHDEPLPVTMRQLESLIGYTFTKKSLLVEAMTHPSCNSPGIRASLDRLEFLGDAILDYVVVNRLFVIDDPAPLENSMLHLLRTALVNKDILAFLVMEWTFEQERIDVDITATTGDEPEIKLVKSRTPLALWTFLRHASPELAEHQRATSYRHAAMREDILHELWHGTHYPWAMFSKLQAQKSFSDIFESVLGAIWVDSGSLEECDKFVEKAGILPIMRRLLERGERLLHPKEALGTLVGAEKVKYVIDVKREAKDGYWTKEFGCRVFVGRKKMADVWGCLTAEEARVKAAEAAVGVLKGKGKGKEVERDREREKEKDEGEEGEEEVDMDLAFTDC